MKKKALLITLVNLVLTLLLAACAQPGEEPADDNTTEYKMAAIFPGVITDDDYNTMAYIGLIEAQKTLEIKAVYAESVPAADVDHVMQGYIDSGYNIIWTHGPQFITRTFELAERFPEVVFITEGDAPSAGAPANLWFIDLNSYVGFYGIGSAAALATQTGKVGYLGGQELPYTYQEIHAIEQAISDLGLNIELVPVLTDKPDDTANTGQLADALIEEDVDVIIGSLRPGIEGVFEAAGTVIDRKILITAINAEKTYLGPENYLTALLYDYADPLVQIVTRIRAGETGGYYPLGFNSGIKLQFPLQNVPEEIDAQVKGIIERISAGEITVVEDSSQISSTK